MSTNKYFNDSNSLFRYEDDDELFLRNRRTASSSAENANSRQCYEEKKKEIEQRTLNSTQRSLNLLRNSEQIGIATAEELQKQREQLQQTDRRLDEITSVLNFSQRQIRGIKSVFGNFKNFLSGSQRLNMPNSRIPDFQDTEFDNDLPKVSSRQEYRENFSSAMEDVHKTQDQIGCSKMAEMLNMNVEEMYQSISRLKGIASELGEEIDSQNDLMDTLIEKTDKVDTRIHAQCKEMDGILKK